MPIDNIKKFYKKISALKDLKDAIKEIKKTLTANEKENDVIFTKNDWGLEKDDNKKLKYLGRKKVIGGVLSHLIGTGDENDNHYRMDVHLEKYNQGIPCIILSVVSPKDEVLDHSPEHYKNIKEAIKAIVRHNLKKRW